MPTTPCESAQDLRRRAEELFLASEALIPELTSPEETEQLFHELRVHQIQLEMQNEELRRAHEDLDASQSRYCDLYDLAPVGYLTISAKKMIKDVNIAAANLFGIVRSLLVKEPICRVIPIEGQYLFYQHLKLCSEAGESKNLEIRLVRGDGALFWAHLQVTPAQNGEYWISISDITERKQLEDERRESDACFRGAFDYSAIGMALVSTEGKWLKANISLCKMLGYCEEDLLAKTFQDITYPDDLETDLNYVRQMLAGEIETYSMEKRYFHKQGQIIWILLSVSLVRDNNDLPLYFISQIENITARKRAENALKESRQRLAGIIEGTRAGTWEWNIQTGDAVFSGRWAEIIGYTLEEISPVSIETWLKYAHPDDLQKSGELLEKHFRGESGYYEYESRMKHKDGHWIWVLDRGKVATWSDDGKPLWMFGTHQDITERKLMVETLAESQALLNNILDGIPDPIYVKDLKGRYKHFNAAAGKFVGLNAAQVLGEDDMAIFPPTIAHGMIEEDRTVAEGAEAITFEQVVPNSAGLDKSFLITKGPLFDQEGNIMGVFGISRDITALKKLESDLATARNAAESANRAKSEFLANMSHEIRTPMNGLLGMTQLLEMTALTEEQQEYMVALKLSGKNLVLLVNDILDLSKIEAGKITIEPVEFSLRRAINEVYMTQKSFIFGNKLSFNITVAEDIPSMIIGDQMRVKQIIYNLLGNAAKFTTFGSITIAIEVHERHNGSIIVQISVTDTGIGIAPEALEKIFNPFVQEDGSTTRQFGGTGLGLTISRRLAELMGGGISVESTQGVGSSFILRLPFTIPTIQNSTEILPLITSPVWDGPPLRILLVEDNPVNLKFGTILLGKHGHEVVTADNGKEGLEALEQGEFDLVLMDVQMPVMNGEAALREIRVKEAGTSCHQKVIALTAYALRNEKERFLSEGFDGYLSKPMEQQGLIIEMKRVMNL